MNRILSMMYYTFLEGTRNRIFFLALIFAFFLLLFSRALSGLSFTEQERIIFDFGAASLNVCLLLLSVYCGVVLLSQELQARALLGTLSKPISRTQFLVGKYLGYLLVCFSVLLLLSLVLMILLFSNGLGVTLHFPLAILGIFFDMSVLLALIFFFSTITNSFLALCFSIAVVLMGHSHRSVKYFAELDGDALMTSLYLFMKYCIPNFEVWNWKDRYYEVNIVSAREVITSSIHPILWIVVILLLASLLFRRKDCV